MNQPPIRRRIAIVALLIAIGIAALWWGYSPPPPAEARVLLPILVDGKVGLIDTTGHIVVAPEYDRILRSGPKWRQQMYWQLTAPGTNDPSATFDNSRQGGSSLTNMIAGMALWGHVGLYKDTLSAERATVACRQRNGWFFQRGFPFIVPGGSREVATILTADGRTVTTITEDVDALELTPGYVHYKRETSDRALRLTDLQWIDAASVDPHEFDSLASESGQISRRMQVQQAQAWLDEQVAKFDLHLQNGETVHRVSRFVDRYYVMIDCGEQRDAKYLLSSQRHLVFPHEYRIDTLDPAGERLASVRVIGWEGTVMAYGRCLFKLEGAEPNDGIRQGLMNPDGTWAFGMGKGRLNIFEQDGRVTHLFIHRDGVTALCELDGTPVVAVDFPGDEIDRIQAIGPYIGVYLPGGWEILDWQGRRLLDRRFEHATLLDDILLLESLDEARYVRLDDLSTIWQSAPGYHVTIEVWWKTGGLESPWGY